MGHISEPTASSGDPAGDPADDVANEVIGNCHKHPHALATERCPQCRALLCEYCLTPLGDTFLCADCARPRRLRMRIKTTAIVVAILAVIGVLVWLLAGTIKGADTDRIAKGQRQTRLTDQQALGQEHAKDPCNKKNAKAWVVDHTNGDCEKILTRAQYYFERCGPHSRLRWATFHCYKERKQYDRAIAEVNRLISRWPYDKDFRWWRGEVYAQKKAWRKALHDYWQAIVMSPAMGRVPFDLEELARNASRKCRAVFPMLQHAYYHPAAKLDVDDRITRLKAMQACPWTLGKGEASGLLSAGVQAPPLSVRVDDKVSGDFAMDLNTGLTMISRDFANRLGIESRPGLKPGIGQGEPFLAWYGNQRQSGQFVVLEKVVWGNARALRVEALILDSPPFFTDGVLGRTFLLRFEGTFNADRTRITLTPRDFPNPTPTPAAPPEPEPDPDQ